MDDDTFLRKYKRDEIPTGRYFLTGSTDAYRYIEEDGSDPQNTVSAIYAVTKLEYHESVAGCNDNEGEERYSYGNQYGLSLRRLCQYIPVSKTKHIWGNIARGHINWREGTGHLRFGKRQLQQGWYFRANGIQIGISHKDMPSDYVFHSQPTDDFYSNIPSVEDIFVFLRYRHKEHVVVGRTSCTIFSKVDATLPVITRLYKWEQSNKYQRVRLQKRHPAVAGHEEENELEIEHRYITIALRHIGLRWPTKLSARRPVWLSAIENLGIAVSQIPRY